MTSEFIHLKAKELLNHGKVMTYKLKADAIKRNEVSVYSLIAELELARKLAMDSVNSSAAVSAVMCKAKVYGLDKLTLKHTGRCSGSIENTIIQVNFVKPAEYDSATA